MPTFDIQLEEPCSCCCVADYGGRTQGRYCVPSAGSECDVCAIKEHRHGKNRWHLSGHCHACGGSGAIPTDFGREVLKFVKRHAGGAS